MKQEKENYFNLSIRMR